MAEVPPEHLRHTAEHEWIAVAGDIATIGVTAFAAEQLSDIVFVGLPAVGDTVTAGFDPRRAGSCSPRPSTSTSEYLDLTEGGTA
ncbi:MAG TPA: hypothetical protein VGM75_30285 [Pseudonocardiaceae bacterium]|jgi:hypothetical protein